MASSVIIDSLKKAHILELLADGKRLDGRSLEQTRELSIDVGVIPKAEGSARARLGDTEVVAGVKVQPERPFPDTGDQGMLFVLLKFYQLHILQLKLVHLLQML